MVIAEATVRDDGRARLYSDTVLLSSLECSCSICVGNVKVLEGSGLRQHSYGEPRV